MLSKMKILTVCSILRSTITFKHITEAQMCVSCQKMVHLAKTRTTLVWDIRSSTSQMQKYSVIAYIWVTFAMQTLSQMKIFTVCSILTNTITLKHKAKVQTCASSDGRTDPGDT